MRWISLLFMVLLTVGVVAAQSDGSTYTTIDGTLSFDVPTGWAVVEEGSSIIISDDDFNEVRGGLLNSAQLFGADALYVDVTGEPFTADVMLQLFADELPEIRANMEEQSGGVLRLPSATYDGPVEVGGYTGATGTFGFSQVYVFDVADGLLLLALDGDDGDGMTAVMETMLETLVVTPFSFDASAYATAITVETAADVTLVTQYVLPGFTVRDLVLLPDGESFIAASGRDAVRVDVATGEIVQRYSTEDFIVLAVALSPDGTTLAAGGQLRPDEDTDMPFLRAWDVESGDVQFESEIDSTLTLKSVGFSPDGSLIAVNAGNVRLHSAVDGVETIQLEGARDGFSFTLDSARIAASCPGSGIVLCFYDVSRGGVVAEITDPDDRFPIRYESVAVAPDGERVFVGFINTDTGAPADLAVWAIDSGDLITVGEGVPDDRDRTTHTRSIESITFSPDGSLVLTASDDDSFRIWETATAAGLFVAIDAHTGTVNEAVLNADATLIFTTGDDGLVRVWAIAN